MDDPNMSWIFQKFPKAIPKSIVVEGSKLASAFEIKMLSKHLCTI